MRLGVKMMEHDIVQCSRGCLVSQTVPRPHDHTVRDYNQKIVQFRYNNTGLDPKYQVHVAGHGVQFADLSAALADGGGC